MWTRYICSNVTRLCQACHAHGIWCDFVWYLPLSIRIHYFSGGGGGATLLQLILFVRCILDGFYFWSLSFPPTGENFAINKATFYVYESCSMCLIPIYTYISSIVPRSTHSVNFYLLKGHDHTMGTRKKFTLTGCRKSFSIIHFIKRHRFHMLRDIILSNWFNCLIVGISFIINYVNHYYTYTIL